MSSSEQADAALPKQVSFSQLLAEALASGDTRAGNLPYGRTPVLYRMLGFPDAELRIPRIVLKKIATGKDGTRPPLDAPTLRRALEDLDDPVALFEDLKGDGLVAVTSLADANGDPIIVALRPSILERHEQTNIVVSAYGRSNPEGWLGRMAPLLIYLGGKKNPRLSLSALDQCQADEGSNEGTERKILRPDDLRKYKEAQWAGPLIEK